MANGYDAQWRVPRREGQKTSKGMQNLQELLGITGGIAERVQQNRDKRQSFDLKMIDLYAGDFQNEFSNERLSDSIKQLEE